MYMTPEELAKERPETLRRYMQMGDKSPLPLGAVRMAMLLQDRIKMDAQAKQAQAQGNGNPNKPKTIVDRIAEAVKQKIQSEPSPQQMAGIGAVPIPNVMQEQNFAGGGIVAFNKGGGGEELSYDQFRNRTEWAESKGDPNAVGPMTKYGQAKGKMQVLDMTNRDPGFGVVAARDDSKEERVRVGNDYLRAMTERYKYMPYASLAYNWGPGKVDNWLKRGANPAEIPKESRAYVIQTTGVDLAKMGPGATTKFSGTDTKGASDSVSQPSISMPPGSEGIRANYTAGRKEALDKMEALRKEREDLLEKPEAPNTEAERRKMLEERAAFRKPFEERMDTLLAGMKPDAEKVRDRSEADARSAMASSLMQTRGRGIGAAIAGLGRGLDSYRGRVSEGEKLITAAERDFQKAQMLGEQEKFKFAKGDYDAANDAATQSTRLYRTAMTEYNKGRETIARDHAANLRSVDQDFDARWKMHYEEARLRRMEDKDARRYADQTAINERQTRAIEERNRRSALDAVSRAIKTAQSGENMERFASEALSTPEYKRLKDAKDRAGADKYVREYAQQKSLEAALAAEGISPAEYQEMRRKQAGLGSLPQAAPAQAAPAQPPATFNMDAAGRFSPAR